MTALNIQAVQNETDEACMVQDMLFKKGVKYEGKEIKNIHSSYSLIPQHYSLTLFISA